MQELVTSLPMKREVNAVLRLQEFVEQHGTQKAAAKELGLSEASLSLMIHGLRGISVATLAKLGLRRTVIVVAA